MTKDKKPTAEELIYDLMEELDNGGTYLTVQDDATHPMYWYDAGVYREYGDSEALKTLTAGHPMLPLHIIDGAVKRMRQLKLVSGKVFDLDINKVTLLNGVLNIDTLKLEPHSPAYPSIIQLPLIYNPNATCPLIDKYFEQVLLKEDIAVAEEIFGYLLIRDYTIKKIPYLIGLNDTGKSVFLSLIRAFIGQNNYAANDIQSFYKDQFSKADLENKLANISGDLPAEALKDTGVIKQLTGRDPIQKNKKYGGRGTFINFAKLIFSANHMIDMNDKEWDKFVSRIQLIFFPHVFKGKNADPDLTKKLLHPSEMSGLLNRAIAGLKRIKGKSEFSRTLTPDEIMTLINANKSTMSTFIYECMEPDISKYIQKSELFIEYEKFCNLNKVPSLKQVAFWKEFWTMYTKNQKQEMDARTTINGKQTQVIWGFMLKPAIEKIVIVTPEPIITTEEPVKEEEFQEIPEEEQDFRSAEEIYWAEAAFEAQRLQREQDEAQIKTLDKIYDPEIPEKEEI